MRYLILSDIHGNWEALQGVLADAAGRYDSILSCGDIVGYGADPNACVDWVRENVQAGIRGNHDKACCGLEDLEWFNPFAQKSARWTQQALRPDNYDYLRQLERGPKPINAQPAFQLIHGSPVDEDEYLIDPAEAFQVAAYLDLPVSFFGHTHLQGGFLCARTSARRLARLSKQESRGGLTLDPQYRYLLNPGSVGQPRDHDPRAGYAIFEPESHEVEFCRVAYDFRETQRKIRQAGLPPILADRLAVGK